MRMYRSYRKMTDAAVLQGGSASLCSKSGRRAQVVRRVNVSDMRRIAADLADAYGVIVIDIDRFQDFNLAYGREAGDRLLAGMAERISAFAGFDAWCRTGDDEFLIVLRKPRGELGELLESIRLALGEPFGLGGATVCASVSIGAALRRPGADDAERLIREATIALRHAKRRGANRWQIYDPGLPDVKAERLELEYELRQAIRTGQLELYYQPRLELASEKVICLEALVRWNHPTRGLIMPREFIPIAEESGLILELGDWVLRRACEQKRVWSESGILTVKISVNISPIQFRDPGFVGRVLRILRETGTHPSSLELEITESSVMEDVDRALEMMAELNVNGCSISIDDFGIGHSSLHRLKLLPVKCLKIDRSFVRNITSDSSDLAITRAIINLGHILNLQVVAEGVEDTVQLELLKKASCTTIQGYLLSPPVKAVDLEQLVREEKLVC